MDMVPLLGELLIGQLPWTQLIAPLGSCLGGSPKGSSTLAQGLCVHRVVVSGVVLRWVLALTPPGFIPQYLLKAKQNVEPTIPNFQRTSSVFCG